MIQAIRGTYDILPGDIEIWHALEGRLRETFHAYGFGEIRTPIFEATELFVRGVGEETDIVSKEMYSFADRDESKSLTLRPEGTAPVIRAFIEHQLYNEARLLKLYYIAPMFRRERPQKGRYRQHVQAGAEVISSTDNPAIEAEVLEMLVLLLGSIGIPELDVNVNSVGDRECRPAFVQTLREQIHVRRDRLCEDCRRRGEKNPLRVFDCKVPSCQPVIAELPTITDNLCEACRQHFDKFKSYLTTRGISFRVNPRLVRGLDYYTRTTFEITSGRLGAQNTVAGGGRYDGLSEQLEGPPAKGFGFGMGLERLILTIPDPARLAPDYSPQYFIAPIGEAAFDHATRLARKLRIAGKRVYLDFDARSLKSQMRLADKMKSKSVIILGEDELKSGTLLLRDMSTKEQRNVKEEEIL
ncbi:MAG: histidine--tRNA ligase [Acidobacteria bacterium]|nr:MAG: histidine--tRNA ligase [Acidobacteriota bacterium]